MELILHLLLAALLWSVVSGFLLWRAGAALGELTPMAAFATGMMAVALGMFKRAKIMQPAARKGVLRIEERGDGRCLGGFLSWKSWAFVVGMALFGRGMRSIGLPPMVIGTLLGGVGIALLLGSVVFWQAFFNRVRSG